MIWTLTFVMRLFLRDHGVVPGMTYLAEAAAGAIVNNADHNHNGDDQEGK